MKAGRLLYGPNSLGHKGRQTAQTIALALPNHPRLLPRAVELLLESDSDRDRFELALAINQQANCLQLGSKETADLIGLLEANRDHPQLRRIASLITALQVKTVDDH